MVRPIAITLLLNLLLRKVASHQWVLPHLYEINICSCILIWFRYRKLIYPLGAPTVTRNQNNFRFWAICPRSPPHPRKRWCHHRAHRLRSIPLRAAWPFQTHCLAAFYRITRVYPLLPMEKYRIVLLMQSWKSTSNLFSHSNLKLVTELSINLNMTDFSVHRIIGKEP